MPPNPQNCNGKISCDTNLSDTKPQPQSKPSCDRSWRVVFGACLIFTLLVGFTRCFGIFYSVIIERLQTTSAAVAAVNSLQNGIRSFACKSMIVLLLQYTNAAWHSEELFVPYFYAVIEMFESGDLKVRLFS